MRSAGEIDAAIELVCDAATSDFIKLIKIAGIDPAVDLRFGNWSGLDLSGADLRGFDFTGADLTGVCFDRALITGAIFDQAIYQSGALQAAADFPTFSVLHSAQGPLGIICGGGAIVTSVVESAVRHGRRVVLFAIKGSAHPDFVQGFVHHWISLGQLGRLFRLARSEGCQELIFVGILLRPALSEVRLDFGMLKALPQLFSAFRGGDDHLLSGVSKLFANEGFRVIALQHAVPELGVPRGAFGRVRPEEHHHFDIQKATSYLERTQSMVSSSAVVVIDGRIVGVATFEGIDSLLRRVAELRGEGTLRSAVGRGVLCASVAVGEQPRIDIPVISPRTVELLAASGLGGLGLPAGGCVIVQAESVRAEIDKCGAFIFGIDPPNADN